MAWEAKMKLGALGITSAIIAFTVCVGSANAFQTKGAPLYAGPNVIIVENGHDRRSYGSSSTLSVSGVIYGQPPRYRNGRGYDRRYGRGNRWKRAPGAHRHPHNHRYDPYGRGTGRGYGRGYGRERYPNPNVNPGRHRNPGYRNPGYRNPGYGNPNYGYGGYGARDHRGPRLTILGATYRSIDGRTCNAYSYAHKKCDGNQSCTVKASNNICGDPDRGRLKILDVTYSCGNQQYTSSTPERSRSKIRCR